MICKHPIRADRLRQIPPSFSWVDHRLIRHHYLSHCDHSAWALYLFLVTVADLQGLSYYSDAAIGRRLQVDSFQLAAARQQLERAGLIAYRKPLYQVLAVPEPSSEPPLSAGPRAGQTQSIAEVLRRALGGGAP